MSNIAVKKQYNLRKSLILVLLSITILLLAGCTQTKTESKKTPPTQTYACPDGSIVTNLEACKELKCTDGTIYGQCSKTKPKYCSRGKLIDNVSSCGCDLDYEVSSDKCILRVDECNDGTKYGECSASKPKECINGTLTDNAVRCGCPENYELYADSCIDKNSLDIYNQALTSGTNNLKLGKQKFDEAVISLDANDFDHTITTLSQSKDSFFLARTNFEQACSMSNKYPELVCSSDEIGNCLIPMIDSYMTLVYIHEDLTTKCSSFSGCPSDLETRCNTLNLKIKMIENTCNMTIMSLEPLCIIIHDTIKT